MRHDRGGHNFRPRSFAPVKVGDELNVTIENVGEKGDGVAKKDGFVLFVPGTKQGDQVKIRVTRVLQKVGFAEVIDGTKASHEEESESSGAESEESYEAPAEEEKGVEPEDDYSGQDTEDFGEDTGEN